MNKVNFLPKFAIIALLMAHLCSCAQLKHRPLIVDESKENHAKIVYKYTHDTVYLQDSSVTSFRNDTIFAEKWHVKYISKSVLDTIRTTDTVILTKVETKMIEPPKKPLKDKIKENLIIGIISIILFLLIKFIIKTLWKQ